MIDSPLKRPNAPPPFDPERDFAQPGVRAASGCLAIPFGLVYALWGNWLIDLMTASEDVRHLAREFLWFVAVAPLLGVFAWGFDGVFIGATWARDMRNLMLLSLVIYIAAWALLRPFGNAGLWGALLVHYAARGGLQALRYPSLLRATFDRRG